MPFQIVFLFFTFGVNGGTSDLNLYSNYIDTFRNKDLARYFTALREISQMYLIDSSAPPPLGNSNNSNKSRKKNTKILSRGISSSASTTNINANAKEIANIIADVRRYDGIFEIEELYEFAARRTDWLLVKAEVEKGLYGYGCGIM